MKNVLWVRPSETPQRIEELKALQSSKELRHLSKSVVEILYNRGFTTVTAIEDFFDNDPMKVHSPYLMMDMEKAVEIVQDAINRELNIVIYGDYDADGASATSIGVLGLRHAGANVNYFINNRFKHGYGLNVSGMDDLLERYPDVDLIVTVDNGIVAYEGIKYAVKKGIRVVVTDHHDPDPSGKMPNAEAIINPKRPGDEYPFKGICGATVIYKFMMALYYEMDLELDYVEDLIDIVGMATIGDVMPLMDENRIFVKEALKRVKSGKRPAFAKLVEKTGASTINEETFGFLFVPMVNAPSRLIGDIDLAVDLFLSEDEEEMEKLVDELISLNAQRKEITAEQEEIAMQMIEKMGEQTVYVLYNPSFHEGIVGLVAGRIKEKFYRPAIVLTEHNGIAKGSGRSIDGFHINNALHANKDALLKFGGHAGACGMSVDINKIDELRERINETASAQLKQEDLEPKLVIDAIVNTKDLTIDYTDELDTLRPFGQGFSKPVLKLESFEGKKAHYMGSESNHLKLESKDKVSIIMFRYAEEFKKLGEPMTVDTIGYPSLNVFRGEVKVQFMVQENHIRKCHETPTRS